MIIKMIGLYGLENIKSYFRKVGDGCFDFTGCKDYASNLTEEEAKKIMDSKEWYLKNYNAELMFIIDKK